MCGHEKRAVTNDEKTTIQRKFGVKDYFHKNTKKISVRFLEYYSQFRQGNDQFVESFRVKSKSFTLLLIPSLIRFLGSTVLALVRYLTRLVYI